MVAPDAMAQPQAGQGVGGGKRIPGLLGEGEGACRMVVIASSLRPALTWARASTEYVSACRTGSAITGSATLACRAASS